MKRLTTAPILQPELTAHPRRIEGDATDVLNLLGQTVREVLHRAEVQDFDAIAYKVINRAQLRLADEGLVVRQVDRAEPATTASTPTPADVRRRSPQPSRRGLHPISDVRRAELRAIALGGPSS